MIRDRVQAIVIATLQALGESSEIEGLQNPTPQTRLFGRTGLLGSLGMINLVLDLEETLFDEFGVNIVIADERALSQRRSPFRDVDSLVAYITNLLDDTDDVAGERHAVGEPTRR